MIYRKMKSINKIISYYSQTRWPIVNLGDVCAINPEIADPRIKFRTGFFIYIDISSIGNGNGQVYLENQVLVNEAPSRARRIVKTNDVIISTVRPNLKAFALLKNLPNRVIASTGFAVLRVRSKLNPDYLFFIINTKLVVKQMVIEMGKGVYPSINKDDIEKIKIPLPPLSEQKKIVKILSTWDQAIKQLDKLISVKQKQFKWLVKSLIGNYQYTNSWKEYSIGELFNAHTYSSKTCFIDNTGERFIVDMGAVSRQGHLILSKRTHIKTDMFCVNDLVMPKDDIGGGHIIGKVAIIETNQKYVCGDHVYRLVQIKNYNSYFFRFLINCSVINKKIRSCVNGTSQLGLSRYDLFKQRIWVPSISQQEHIVKILRNSESEIEKLQRLFKKYQEQKKGLMQKLLTGRIRL